MYPYFDAVVGLAWSKETDSYAGGSVATGGDSHTTQVNNTDSDKKGQAGPPG